MKITALLLTSLFLASCRGPQAGAAACETFSVKAGQVAAHGAETKDACLLFMPVSEALGLQHLQETQEQNEVFRRVPEHFKPIDFENRSYLYQFSYNKKKLKIALKDGEFDYDFRDIERGGFSLSDVYYLDLTGDGQQEAIVKL